MNEGILLWLSIGTLILVGLYFAFRNGGRS